MRGISVIECDGCLHEERLRGVAVVQVLVLLTQRVWSRSRFYQVLMV